MKNAVLAATALMLMAGPLLAVDADSGKELYDDVQIERDYQGEHRTDISCETCHDTAFYERSDRKVTTYAKLEAQVEGCNTNLDVGWFPEDVADVAAYMNREYYKFAKSAE
ncbi:hypothetical protein [Amphritea balenae]|uniref:Cytochrome c domain-containing protein n=1 Tax=Amphritea balenae TaxID=452629 RepID=A0A3P1SK94_9GAMM|nr:hypothetical protein [Amphritea balenae]RRC97713.1 hypothetical protein EHS89_16155 [Amphritea balenae]GGK82384.1 hypothetical protein GCM10007941_36070 [Amphritea balenae]